MDELNVLLTSAGRRVELMQCIRQSAGEMGLAVKVYAGDLQPVQSPACHFADKAFPLPRCTDGGYAQAVLDICLREGVKLVIPTIDTELLALSEALPLFAREGIRLHTSDAGSIAICRDKMLTAEALDKCGIPTPRTSRFSADLDWKSFGLPLIIKPAGGSSSINIQTAHNERELASAISKADGSYIVQELVTGAEYTVNCYFDPQGTLRCAVPHRRIRVRSGEVSVGRTEPIEALETFARRLQSPHLPLRGAICFQAILGENGAKVFEINARFGGGYPLAHKAGAPFVKWLMQETLGVAPDYSNNWEPDLTMLRYDQSVFVKAAR